MTLLRVLDRWREDFRHWQLAEFFVQLEPRVDATRHADRQEAGRRNRLRADFLELLFELIVTQTKRRSSAAVEAVEFLGLGVVDDGKQIAANSVADRLHQSEG